jgi:hypothetical protein
MRRFISFLLLFQFINLSVDSIDADNQFARLEVNGKINDIESLFELVSEAFFCKNVPETSEDDIETIHFDFQVMIPTLCCFIFFNLASLSTKCNSFYASFFLISFHGEVSPPPKLG